MADVKNALEMGKGIKRTCERPSWLSPSDLSSSGPHP